MLRPVPTLTAALSALLLTTTAYAESPNAYMLEMMGYDNRGYGEPLVPRGIGLDRSSVGYETIRQAANTNAQVYGAIGAFDRYLRPMLDSFMLGDAEGQKDRVALLAYDHHQSYGVGRAVGLCSGIPGQVEPVCDGRPRRYSADLYSASIAGAWGNRRWGYFGSASYSVTIIPPLEGTGDQAIQRGLFATYLGILTVGGMPIYRLLGKNVFNKLMPGSADGILGGYGAVGPVRGYAGYVLSRGAFGDLAVPEYSPFATALLSQSFGSLALLRGGLRDMNLGKALGLPEESGLTSLFLQRTLLPVPRVDPSGASLEELAKDLVQVPLVTTHLRQLNLADYVDLKAAVGALPKVFLHEATIAVHSKETGRRKLVPSQGAMRAFDDGFAWYVSVGTASLPPLYYYAVSGGNRFSFKAQLAYGPFSLFARMNDPEFLQAFPFADNALNAGLAVALSED